jgi:hypothetical protein
MKKLNKKEFDIEIKLIHRLNKLYYKYQGKVTNKHNINNLIMIGNIKILLEEKYISEIKNYLECKRYILKFRLINKDYSLQKQEVIKEDFEYLIKLYDEVIEIIKETEKEI